MEEIITSVGVPGIIVILIFREVLHYKFRKNGNNESCISREEFEKHKSSVQYKDNCEQIVKRLDEANRAQEIRFNSIDKQFDEVKSLIKSNGK